MKNTLKFSLLILLSAGFIFWLMQKNLIDFKLIQNAFRNNLWCIFGVAALQLINYIAMAFRYKSILKILNVERTSKDVLAVTFMSNGIGQWLPGSLAFIEIIRVKLLNKTTKENQEFSQEVSHLAIASVFDRLIGFFVMLFVGALLTLYFIVSLKNLSATNTFILYAIAIFNCTACLIILALPLTAGSKFIQHLLAKLELFFLRIVSHPSWHKRIMHLFHKINHLIKIFSEHGQNRKAFVEPILLSFCALIGFAMSLKFASAAFGMPLPFFVTIAVISILGITTSLPISVGGIGAPQLVAAITFGAFGVDSAVAASTQLLQTGITLITVSLCALYYVPQTLKKIVKQHVV